MHKNTKKEQYNELLKKVLPRVGSDSNKIILAEVMLALKQEGLIGEELTKSDSRLINLIKETIMCSPEEMEKALETANQINQ